MLKWLSCSATIFIRERERERESSLTANMAETVKTHVAVLPSPGMGHIIPLLEFAKRLVIHYSIHVSFLIVTTTESSAAMEQLLRSATLPPGLDVVDLPPVDVAAVATDDMKVLTRISVILEESLLSLKSILLDLDKPKAVVIDLFCTKAFQICSELSIPAYTFCTASVAVFSFFLYFPALDRETESELVDLPEPVQVPGCAPIRTDDLLDQVRDRKSDEYKWCLLHLSRLPLAAGVFLNSWEDLEPVAFKAIRENPFYKQIPVPPVHLVGPLINHGQPPSPTDTECLAWLDKQPPDSVLFVALGSGGTLSTEQLTELAYGLELSQQRFIWVSRKPTDVSGSGTFFTVGSNVNDPTAYLPEGFLQRTRGVGLVVPSWGPQVEVLRHPSTGGFLSHCGWNSSVESITHGVPMIAWPLYAEQRMNATVLAEDIGVAIKPVPETGTTVIRREEIERAVRTLIQGEEGKAMRRRATELKETAAKALDSGGSSCESLSRIVNYWKLI